MSARTPATGTVRLTSYDAAPRIRDQPQQAVACGEAVRVVEAKKQIGPLKKVNWLFVFICAAFNLYRIPKLREQHA
jgi:hypothetical protein